MNLDDPRELRSYIEGLYILEQQKGPRFSLLESELWGLARYAPYGAKVIFTNPDGTDPYLMRVYLTPQRQELSKFLAGLGLPSAVAKMAMLSPRLYLHYFFRGDEDRAFHNHPWKEALSFILTKGYREHRWDFLEQRATSRLIQPGQFNLLRRGDFHKVELLPTGGCWTLFASGRLINLPRGKDWDFFDPDTKAFTSWEDWTIQREQEVNAKLGSQRPLRAV